MNTVLVMNAGSIQDHVFADPDAVTAGVIAAFDGDGTVIVLDNSVGAADAVPESMIFVQGHDDQPRNTSLIKRSDIIEVIKKSYVAPDNQVTTISAIPTGTAGVASVRIQDLTLGYSPFPKRTYEVQVAAGDSATDIATKLRTQINGDAKRLVDATGAATLILTARDRRVSFHTSIEGVIEDATVAVTTEPTQGTGTPEQVRSYEELARGFMTGEYYQNSGLLGSPPEVETYSIDGNTYNQYIMRVKTDSDRAINRAAEEQRIFLVFEAGITGDLDDFFSDYLRNLD